MCANAVNGGYRAAVVEYSPISRAANNSLTRDQAVDVMKKNLNQFEAYIKQAAANKTQIIVFPEYGIYGDGPYENGKDIDYNRKGVFPFAEAIPAPSSGAPCDGGPSDAVITVQASCLAKKYNIAVVIDMADKLSCNPQEQGCRKDGFKLFNTAVAFDTDGTLLAKYHKNHLYGDEPLFFDSGKGTPFGGKTNFTTSFGVRFGMFICFDILWETQETLTNFVFPTDWVNAAPFEKATEAQTAWSALHKANFLASNYGGFAKKSSGSGIYSKGLPLAKFFNPTDAPQSRMLVADVPLL